MKNSKLIIVLPFVFLLAAGCASIKINDSIEATISQNWATIGPEYRAYVEADAALAAADKTTRITYADKFDALLADPTDELRLDKARAATLSAYWVPISAIYEAYVEGDAVLSDDGKKIRKRSADMMTYLLKKACAD